MDFSQKVKLYFNFSGGLKTNIYGKEKSRIFISGRLNISLFIFWILISSFLALITILVNINENINMLYGIILVLVTITVLAIIISFKSKLVFKKLEPKKTNLNYYQRELPSKLRPAHVRMLIHDGLIDEYSMAATILDLVDKKYIELTKVNSKEELFNNHEIIIKRTEKDLTPLFLYEQYLMEWFIDILGNKIEVSQSDIHKGLMESTNASQKFEEFQALVMLSFPLSTYYQKRSQSKASDLKNIIYLFGGFALTFMGWGFISYFAFLLFSYTTGKLLFTKPLYTLNLKGVDEGDAWLDLKRFLIDFSEMKDKTSEMIILWNYYLTYSIALDVNSIASKEIKNFFGTNIYKSTKINNQNTMSYSQYKSWQGNIENTITEIKIKNEQELAKYNN